MSEPNNGQIDGVSRKPSLIAGTTKKMAATYVLGTVCAAAVVIIDSLVAGVSIGAEALAAIAAAGPLLTVGEILHCLLGYGIDKLMVQAIGEGNRREANRIFGAVLLAVTAVYLLVFGAIILLERPLLELIMDDMALIDMVIDYTVPLFATEVVFEVFLCIERAFRIDGRAKLFSKRAIVTNIANIAFDILMVSVLELGVSGLAWASVISTAIGYTVTLSHFFSKKRTVSPDLSVLFSMKELLSYVKRDMCLGNSATLDELMSSVVLAAQTAVIGVIGGSGGLAIWAVYKSLRGVAQSVGNGVSASVSVHTGLLYGGKDYEGVRYSVKEGAQIAVMTSIAASLLVLLLASPIAVVYGIDPELQHLCSQCLRIGCAAFPFIAFLTVITSYLPAVDRVKLASNFVMVQHGLTLVPAIFGYAMGLLGFFASYVGALCAATLVMAVLMVRDRHWFVPEHNPETIAVYSIQLKPDQISAASANSSELLADLAYPTAFCIKVALVVEDCLGFIAQNNSNAEVHADIEFKRREDDVLITIVDDGSPYNPLAGFAEGDLAAPGTLEAIIITGFTADVDYDRVLDLNHISMLVKPAGENRTGLGDEAGEGPGE